VPAAPAGGVVEGRLRVGLRGVELARVGEIVVFLEPADGAGSPAAPGPVQVIHQRDARFEPAFVVLVAGQTLELPNEDIIFHNVFSYSKPNDFDLGILPRGSTRSVTFRYPGLVRLYCSIHESMSASVFVVPTPHFSRPGADGGFAIRDVPAGPWRLRVWSWRLPSALREIEVRPGAPLRVELDLISPDGSPLAVPAASLAP
jgi:plastocyanin